MFKKYRTVLKYLLRASNVAGVKEIEMSILRAYIDNA